MIGALAAISGALLGVGIWVLIAGVRKSPERIKPTREHSPLAQVARLLGVDPGGRLYAQRRVLAIGTVVGVVAGVVTGWFVLAVIIPVLLVGLPALFRKTSTSTEVDKLTDLTTWVRSLIGVLSGGAVGLEQAIRATLHSAPTSVRPAVARLVARLDAGQSITPALERWAEEMDDYSADLIAAALILEAGNRAGAITLALRQLADSLAAQAKARRDIETERSMGRATVRWVTIITIVVMGGTSLTGYLQAYRSPLGQVIALVLFSAYVVCLMWMRKISLGKPIPRFLPADGKGA